MRYMAKMTGSRPRGRDKCTASSVNYLSTHALGISERARRIAFTCSRPKDNTGTEYTSMQPRPMHRPGLTCRLQIQVETAGAALDEL